jgi:hypothetical protein
MEYDAIRWIRCRRVAAMTTTPLLAAPDVSAFKVRGQWHLRRTGVASWIRQQVDDRRREHD